MDIKMLRKIFIPVFILIVILIGCDSKEETHIPGQPNVSREQATQLAQRLYNVHEINDVVLKHLDNNEWNYLSAQQKELTPIYYVISGQQEKIEVRVYVSSHELSHHFMLEVD